MTIKIAPDLEQLVREKMESGRYGSEDDLLREALRLLDNRDRESEAELEELRRKIAVGLEQLDRGDKVPASEVFTELRRKSQERRGANL